jgi:predicted ATPase
VKTEVFGRDEELAAIGKHLDREREARGPSALVLEGEPGIGKSTLLRAATDQARESGYRVLEARPAERS